MNFFPDGPETPLCIACSLGNIEIVIAKELTKIHETFIRGNIDDILKGLGSVKGEYIILFENHAKTDKQIEIENINKLSLDEQYMYYINKGLSKKEAVKQIAKNNNVQKNEVYMKFI